MTPGERLDRAGHGAGRRAGPLRGPGRRARAGLPQRRAGVRAARRAGPAAAAHPHRRADGRLPRARPGAHQPTPGRGGHHQRHRRRQPPPGRARGLARRRARWSCSPPTGRPGCAAPTPTRPPTRSRLFGGAVRMHADLPAATPAAARSSGGRWPRGGRSPRAPPPPPGPARRPARAGAPEPPARGAAGPRRLRRLGSALDGCAEGEALVSPGDQPRRPADAARAADLRTVVVAGDDAGAAGAGAGRGGPAGRCSPSPPAARAPATTSIRTYRLLLGDEELAGRIEQVVVFGHPTLSRPVARLLARDDVEIVRRPRPVRLDRPGPPRPRRGRAARARRAVRRRRRGPARRLARRSGSAATPSCRRRLDALLAAEPGLTPQQVAGAVSAAVPPGGLLFVGASNPVRDLDLMVAPYAVGDRRMVVGNRGLAGIDGSVSTRRRRRARPAAQQPGAGAARRRDLPARRQRAGARSGRGAPRPDDRGGQRRRRLDLRHRSSRARTEHATSYDQLFGTPHGVDLASLCAATRTPHWRVDSLAELRHALANPAGGIEVVEAVVRRDNRRALDEAVRALVPG